MKQKLLLILFSLVISGFKCAAQAGDSLATLIIYRPFKLFGWGVNYRLKLDKQEICRLSNRRYVVVKAPPGMVTLRSYATGANFITGNPERILRFPVAAQQTYFIETNALFWLNALELAVVPQAFAAARLKRIPQPDHCSQGRYAAR